MGKYGKPWTHRVRRLAVAAGILLAGLQLGACGKYTEKEVTAATGYPADEIGQPQIMYGGVVYYYEAAGYDEMLPDSFTRAGAVEVVDNKNTPATDFQGARVEKGQEIYSGQEQSCIYVKYDQGYARFAAREIDISTGDKTAEAETAAGQEALLAESQGEGGLLVESAEAEIKEAQTNMEVQGSGEVLAEVSETDGFFRQSGMKKEEAAAFVKTFADAVASGERESAAAMISYPRKVKTPAWEGTVSSPEEFLTYYDDIFTADFRNQLENASLDDLFCRNGLISFGDGSLWFYPATETEDMSVCTVNAANDRYVRYDGPSGVQPG